MSDLEDPTPYTLTIPDSSTLPYSESYSGPATATYPNGDSYNGAFINGVRHGLGTYTFASGAVYSGHYSNNLRHGKGCSTLPDGSYFDGIFAEGTRVFGTARYVNKDAYHGPFSQGKRHGSDGVYIFGQSKSRLIGKWVDGEIVEGTWKLFSGETWEGKFVHGKPVGQGEWRLKENTEQGEYMVKKAPVDFGLEDAVEVSSKWRAHKSHTEAQVIEVASRN
jgi:radial spoke head protein 1